MKKLYFKYGVMGSSKSAQALMTKFNYEQKGFRVLLIKPSIDNRDDNGKKFVEYDVSGLSQSQIDYLDENLDKLVDIFL